MAPNGARGFLLCGADRQPKGGQTCTSRPSMRYPFYLKNGANLGQDGSKADRKRIKAHLTGPNIMESKKEFISKDLNALR